MILDGPVNEPLEIIPMALVAAAAIVTVIRLVRGPTLPDRVVALDLLTILGLGMLVLYAIAADEPVYLDIGIVLTLVTFLGTISFAYFIERGAPPGRRR